ncbi:MAG: helix-turn-helix domain-containing protein [Alphaproteobacteria bacterium]|jgi:DNA-binding HxlR family transcriptional regulator|nr:helix-turn-helix domain-containing protein [Alphaproteobacteria bacterium]
MATASYQQFCPVAMAAEILCNRWTIVLLRELCAGSTRFNDLRRGVPRMSPALLSTRLKELESHGVLKRTLMQKRPEIFDYRLTKSGEELLPVVEAIGIWGHRWVESDPSLENLDPSLLMWDMRRNLNVEPLPSRRITIHITYPELPQARQNWWLLIDPTHGVDLCSVDPGFDVDLFSRSDLRTMTAIWMGLDTVSKAISDDRLTLTGDREIAKDMQQWLGLSPFAVQKKQVT